MLELSIAYHSVRPPRNMVSMMYSSHGCQVLSEPLWYRWLLCWLKRKHLTDVTWDEALEYLLKGVDASIAANFEESMKEQVRPSLY